MDFEKNAEKESTSTGLCRCCLSEGSEGCYKDLDSEYSWMKEKEIYANMLLECFDISISQHPTGPNGSNRLICEVCITRLRDACAFRKQVLCNESKLMEMLRQEIASNDNGVVEMEPEPESFMKPKIEHIFIEEHTDSEYNGVVKIEPEPESCMKPNIEDIDIEEHGVTTRHCARVNNKHFNETIANWMQLVDELSDFDMDVDQDDEAVNLLTNMSARDPSSEPATEADLTDFEAQVLLAEDRQNDLALREIVSRADYNFEWDKDKRVFKGQRETFTAPSGPTFPITEQTRAVDIFYKMCDSDLLDRLCLETNRYASQKIALLKTANKLLPNSRLQRWTPIYKDEMISFLALTMLQGLYPLPDEESYFSFNGFGSMPYFSRIMSYNRYFLINSMLHFVDNENLTEPTKLSKIQPITDYFNKKFSSLYYPGQEIAIDESLLKWHGRLGFAQKIMSKATQVGVKTYELCELSSGYLWKFFVYAGKTKPSNTAHLGDDTTVHVQHSHDMTGPEIDTTDSTDRPTNATAKIIYDLVEPLLHKGHTLIMDNFYNSPLLARFLKRQKTDCYGTLRLNREFVPDSLKTLNKSDLRRGEVVASYCPDLSVIVWRDANIVSLISTYHSLQVGTKTKYNGETYKPSIVLDYNKSMGGVERKDQYLFAHLIERNKNKVWYKKLYRRMFNAAIFNCFVIFAKLNPKINHRQFRTTLAEDLLKIHRQIDLTDEKRLITRRSRLTTTTSTVRPKTHQRPRLEHRHFPTRTGFKQSRCWMCAQRKVTTRTVWKCMECDVNLCIDRCFMNYHI